MEPYNDTERKPMFLLCGHSFCSKCLRLVWHKHSLVCPLDKKTHKFETFDKIPVNYSILNIVHQQRANGAAVTKSDKKCEAHPRESLKFFCISHQAIICQECMLESHLGAGHEIVSAEKMIQSDLLKQDTQRCLDKINRHLGQLNSYHESLSTHF